VQGLFDFLKAIGAARLAAMVVVTPGCSDLNPAEPGAIVKDLDRHGIQKPMACRRGRLRSTCLARAR
jgi:hypothetical protein